MSTHIREYLSKHDNTYLKVWYTRPGFKVVVDLIRDGLLLERTSDYDMSHAIYMMDKTIEVEYTK